MDGKIYTITIKITNPKTTHFIVDNRVGKEYSSTLSQLTQESITTMDILKGIILNNPIILRELAKELNNMADAYTGRPAPQNNVAVGGLAEVGVTFPQPTTEPDPAKIFAKPALVASTPPSQLFPDPGAMGDYGAGATTAINANGGTSEFVPATDAELDSAGEPWNADDHSKGQTKTNDGKWRKKKNKGVKAAVAPVTTIKQGTTLPITYQELYDKTLQRQTAQPDYATDLMQVLEKNGLKQGGFPGLQMNPAIIPQVDAELDQAWAKYTQ